MSTVNNGSQIVKNSLAFVLDPTVSAGFIKTPKQISNCITWFDADDLSTITTETSTRNVRYWADKSNSNLVLTGGGLTLANEPLSVIGGLNGRNTVRCDGGDYLSCAFTTTYTEFTIFYVFKGNESNNSRSHILSVNNAGASSGNFEFDLNDNYGSAYQTMWVYWNGGGSPSSVIGLTSPNTKSDFLQGSPTLFTFSHTNAGSGTNTIYVNGRTRSDQLNSSTQTITLGGAGNSLFLGARVASGLYYTGDICEVIIYSRQLSATERSQVQNYLSNKWRIPLLQSSSTNVDLVNRKSLTVGSNNVPVIDKCYRLNPADSLGSPKSSNFFVTDPTTYLSNIISTTITMEAWVKPNSFSFAGTNTDIGAIMICGGNFYLSLDGNGKFNAFMYGSGGSTVSHQPSTTSVTRHVWNHVVWTFDGAYIRWYLNGVLDKTSSTTFTIGTISVGSYIGIGAESNSTYGRMLDGYVAGCKIYGKPLTASEVSQNYESSKTEFYSLPNIVTGGLQLYLDADVYSSYVGSGTTWTDLSGNGFNGTLTNGPSFISTEPKNLSFDGSDDYSISSVTNIAASSTVTIWLRSSSYSGNKIPISINGDSYSSGPNLYFSESTINWNTGDGAVNPFTNSSYPDSDWHYIVVTNDASSNAKLYIDGVLIGTAAYRSTASTTSNNFWIGRFHDGSYLLASNIAQVKLYTRVLSSTEVLQNYNATKFRFGK